MGFAKSLLVSALGIFPTGMCFAVKNAAIDWVSIPETIKPGVTTQIRIRVKNTGDETWQNANIALRSTRPDGNNRWNVVAVPALTTAPGQSFEFVFNVRGPASGNSNDMGWRMYNNSGAHYFGTEVYRKVASQDLPGQFIAKMYTEALGRAPDPAGWGTWLNHFKTNGSNLASLRSAGNYVFSTSEFTGLGYDNEARLIALYRTAFSRDPDPAGFIDWRNQLNAGTPFSTVVSTFFNSGEFSAIAGQILSGNSYGWLQAAPTSYPPTVSAGSDASCNETFTGGNGAALQAMLERRRGLGGRVCLARKVIVPVSQMLTIPPGVTLATVGAAQLNRQQYALFGRLVRVNTTTRGFPLVVFGSSSALENVWVDGQESSITRVDQRDINLGMYGSNGAQVRECKLSDAPGWSNLQIDHDVSGAIVTNNTITCYPSRHWTGAQDTWTDGISVAGTNTNVSGNHVVDATDVGIVMFCNVHGTQTSDFVGNTVLNAGNSAYAGIGLDQSTLAGTAAFNFSGATIDNNTIWAGPKAHMDIALCVGTRPWWDSRTRMGTGIAVRGNTSGSQLVNANMGIALNNMNSATLQTNSLTLNMENSTGFPFIPILVQTRNVSPLTNIQAHTPRTDDATFDAKVFHSQ